MSTDGTLGGFSCIDAVRFGGGVCVLGLLPRAGLEEPGGGVQARDREKVF